MDAKEKLSQKASKKTHCSDVKANKDIYVYLILFIHKINLGKNNEYRKKCIQSNEK